MKLFNMDDDKDGDDIFMLREIIMIILFQMHGMESGESVETNLNMMCTMSLRDGWPN